MSVLRSSRYNPGSMYNAHPPTAKDDVWDHRPSTESLRDDKVYPHSGPAGTGGVDNQYAAYPSASGTGHNRDSRYDDAYDDQHYGHDQGGYGGPVEQGYAQQGYGNDHRVGGGGGGGGYGYGR